MLALGSWLAAPIQALVWPNSGSVATLVLSGLLLLSVIGLAAVGEWAHLPKRPQTNRADRRLPSAA